MSASRRSAEAAQSRSKKVVVGNYYYYTRDKEGSGQYATVYKGYEKETNRVVAIKVILMKKLHTGNAKHDARQQRALEHEIKSLQLVDHPNVLKLLNVERINDSSGVSIYLILEYCSGGDLSKVSKPDAGNKASSRGEEEKCNPLPESQVQPWICGLVAGLSHMHEKGLIHRDLKPGNLLLSCPGVEGIIKIADFGFTRVLDSDLAQTRCGSPLYMAPEVLTGQRYDGKVDLWSVGVILYELVVGRLPFPAASIPDLLELHRAPVKVPGHVSPQCKDLILSLLRPPVQRISYLELKDHPFVAPTRSVSMMLSSMNIGAPPASDTVSRPSIAVQRGVTDLRTGPDAVPSPLTTRPVSGLSQSFQRSFAEQPASSSPVALSKPSSELGTKPSLGDSGVRDPVTQPFKQSSYKDLSSSFSNPDPVIPDGLRTDAQKTLSTIEKSQSLRGHVQLLLSVGTHVLTLAAEVYAKHLYDEAFCVSVCLLGAYKNILADLRNESESVLNAFSSEVATLMGDFDRTMSAAKKYRFAVTSLSQSVPSAQNIIFNTCLEQASAAGLSELFGSPTGGVGDRIYEGPLRCLTFVFYFCRPTERQAACLQKYISSLTVRQSSLST